MKYFTFVLLSLISCLIVAFTFAFSANQDQRFYYAFDEKIPLTPKEKTIAVKYMDGFDKALEEKVLKQLSKDLDIKWRNERIAEISFATEGLGDTLKTSMKSNASISSIQQFYTLENGPDIIIFDEILLKFKASITKQQQENLIKKFNVKIIESHEIFEILKIEKGDDALEIANKIYESGLLYFQNQIFFQTSPPYKLFQMIHILEIK